MRRNLTLLGIAALLACGKLGTNLDDVVALEIVLPDSGRMVVGDHLFPGARALNGRGDSVAAEIFWSSLDTAVIAVLDSATGETLGKTAGTGRLQARTGPLRSNPQSVIVRVP
jgi:hypothetical protein